MKPTRIVDPMLIAQKTKEGGMSVRLDPAQIGSGAAGGIILADLARHFARALAASRLERSEDHALAEILRLFQAEIERPTDTGEGALVN